MRLSKADSTPPYRLQLDKSVVLSLGHLRITAHIRRQLTWSVRDSWVNCDRLESVGRSRQSFSDLNFSEIVERSCTFSCPLHRSCGTGCDRVALSWVRRGWSARQRPNDPHWPPPPQLAQTVNQLRTASSNCLSRLNLTAAYSAQLGTIVRDWSWPILDELVRVELSWSRSIYVKWALHVEYDMQLLGVSEINFLPHKIINIMHATTSNLKSFQNQFCICISRFDPLRKGVFRRVAHGSIFLIQPDPQKTRPDLSLIKIFWPDLTRRY